MASQMSVKVSGTYTQDAEANVDETDDERREDRPLGPRLDLRERTLPVALRVDGAALPEERGRPEGVAGTSTPEVERVCTIVRW